MIGFLSHKFSVWNRNRKLKLIEEYISDLRIESCLIVGAKSNAGEFFFDNLIEKHLVELIPNTLVTGVDEISTYWNHWQKIDGREMKFQDQEFDFVFSNAVIEHVGDELDQKKFISEHARVGRYWVLTTPNRFFPIESHTQKIFVHFRRGWRHSDITRLLSKKDLIKIVPGTSRIKGSWFSPTFFVFKSKES